MDCRGVGSCPQRRCRVSGCDALPAAVAVPRPPAMPARKLYRATRHTNVLLAVQKHVFPLVSSVTHITKQQRPCFLHPNCPPHLLCIVPSKPPATSSKSKPVVMRPLGDPSSTLTTPLTSPLSSMEERRMSNGTASTLPSSTGSSNNGAGSSRPSTGLVLARRNVSTLTAVQTAAAGASTALQSREQLAEIVVADMRVSESRNSCWLAGCNCMWRPWENWATRIAARGVAHSSGWGQLAGAMGVLGLCLSLHCNAAEVAAIHTTDTAPLQEFIVGRREGECFVAQQQLACWVYWLVKTLGELGYTHSCKGWGTSFSWGQLAGAMGVLALCPSLRCMLL